MNLKPEEISSVIREQMKKYDVQLEVKEAGTIIQVADGVARIHVTFRCHAGSNFWRFRERSTEWC